MTQFEIDCERYNVTPLPGESIGAALCREFESAMRDAICFATHRLPVRLQNRKPVKSAERLDDDLQQGFRVPSMSLAEIESRL